MFSGIFSAKTSFGKIMKVATALLALLIFPLSIFVWALLSSHGTEVNLKKAAEDLAHKLGIAKDIYIEGSEKIAIVDKKLKKALFITSPSDYSVYNLSEIIDVKHEWTQYTNHIVFTVRDDSKPIFRAGRVQRDDAEKIMARLDMLINDA